MKHTETPWIATPSLQDKSYVITSQDQIIGSGMTEANAQYIVACVNACKDINPESVPELLEACMTLLKDCQMALAGEWDRSDSGFKDSTQVLSSALIAALGEKRFFEIF